MKKYKKNKEKARQEAINWQRQASNESYSCGEIADFTAYFCKKAKRYGLIKEFKENCII